MAKAKKLYVCQNCGASQNKWAGQCPACSEWNSLVEEQAPESAPKGLGTRKGRRIEFVGLKGTEKQPPRRVSKIAEFDRVTGGGLVPGSATLVGGDPGIGKSTLLMQVAAALSGSMSCAYISGEESIDQLRLRAERLDLAETPVGLAAATSHRGVRHIRIPTTVLSQNDSGVGVKNAVNFKGIKNYVGTFAPPWAVLNDLDFLDQLPGRERVSGIVEAVKVALIRDPDFYRWLEQNADALATFAPEAEEYMIRRSAELHMRQIAHGGDPFEMGSARPLDFGHWSAHKLEAMTNHHVRHGEAVAIGIALDARYSVLVGLLAEGDDERIVVLLENLGLRIWHPALESKDADGKLSILTGLRDFQEHLGGDLTITLLKSLGRGHEVHQMDATLVRQAIAWLKLRKRA